jgi:hypothetical protein
MYDFVDPQADRRTGGSLRAYEREDERVARSIHDEEYNMFRERARLAAERETIETRESAEGESAA